MKTAMHCTPELTAFLAARDRVAAAQAGLTSSLAKLKALDAADRPVPDRRPTLLGVAPPNNMHQQRAALVAAMLTARPNGRY